MASKKVRCTSIATRAKRPTAPNLGPQMENITNALKAIRALGMKEFEMFSTIDLYEEKNLQAVSRGTSLLREAPNRESPTPGRAGRSLHPRAWPAHAILRVRCAGPASLGYQSRREAGAHVHGRATRAGAQRRGATQPWVVFDGQAGACGVPQPALLAPAAFTSCPLTLPPLLRRPRCRPAPSCSLAGPRLCRHSRRRPPLTRLGHPPSLPPLPLLLLLVGERPPPLRLRPRPLLPRP